MAGSAMLNAESLLKRDVFNKVISNTVFLMQYRKEFDELKNSVKDLAGLILNNKM